MDSGNNMIPVSIPEFFKGQSIFITGFSGALGKILVEKLLYSCPDIDKIYVLIRIKKGKDPQDRLEEICKSMAYNRLQERYPGLLKSKLIAMKGTVLEDNFGLSEDNLETLKREVSIIFHGAASVRFDDPLDEAFKINTYPTIKLIELALTMQKLKCLTHISTAYTNCDHIYIKEEVSPSKLDWNAAIKISQNLDPTAVRILSKKVIGDLPNTYVFSKSLAEQTMNEYRNKLPITIVRPSIVIPSVHEPLPGWCDNLYGPIAIVIGCFLGLVRCFKCVPETKCNYIPSDIVVNAIIVASWKTAMTYKPDVIQESATVYNICSPNSILLNHHEFSQQHKFGNLKYLLAKSDVNVVSVKVITSKLWFNIHTLYRQIFSALFIDGILLLMKKDPILLKLRKRIHVAINALSHFTANTFKFESNNFDNLVNEIRPEDKKSFEWDFNRCDLRKVFDNAFILMRRTMAKPFEDDFETNRKRIKALYFIDKGVVFLIYTLLAWLTYSSGIPQAIITFFVNELKYFF